MTDRDWQDIATAPKDGTWILVARGNQQGVVCYTSRNIWILGALCHFYNPTHWQPLPDPPITKALEGKHATR